MTPLEEIVERYSAARPGFRLLRCDEAALPFFWLTLDAVVQEKKRLPPLHEYVMRTIYAGHDTVAAIAGFLGVEASLVERVAADLWEYDYLDYPSIGALGRSLRMTREGLTSLEELTLQGPERREIWIAFDRVLWEPILIRRAVLLPPREIKDLDVFEVRPCRQARPDLADLDIGAIDKQLKQLSRVSGEVVDVLAVHRVLRAERMFLPSHLLVYQAKDGKEAELSISIDGRPSNRHDDAVAALGGVDFLGISIEPPAAEDEVTRATSLASGELERIRTGAVPLDEVERIRTRTAQAIAHLDDLGRSAEIGEEEVTDREVQRAVETVEHEINTVEAFDVREIDTFEHALLFDQARRNSRHRLLVISPWISGKVVTKAFIDELRALARKKVTIRIGYGINANRARDERDRLAEDQLLKLSRDFDNVVVARLGDTHAKVLVSDDTVIVGSFNWLSFRGDRERTYRQERGMMVRVKSTADASYDEHSQRIEGVEGQV
jgi:hypothetical protein